MILHYCELTDDTLEFGFSEGKTCVDIKMPYGKFNEIMGGIPGTLDEKCEMYINNMTHLAELLT